MAVAELLFIGQIAPDRTAGEDVAAQAQSVLSRLTVALSERGLVLDDLLRLRLFVRDLDELSTIEQAMDRSGTTEWPAVSVVEPPAGSSPGAALTLDAVAASGAHEQRQVMRSSTPGSNGVRGGLGSPPCSVRLGPWVFVGATAASAAHGTSPSPPDAPDVTDSMTWRVGEESRVVFAHIAELLRGQGADLRDAVKVGGWLAFPVRQSDYRPLGDVREALLTEAGLFPASAAVQVGRVQRGALLAFEAIAFAPQDPAERERWRAAPPPPPSPLAPYYASARSAGGHVFTCGEVPTGTVDRARPIAVDMQADEVYKRLGADLAAHGASPTTVLHQTVFLRHARDRDAVADAGSAFFGENAIPPPTTLLTAADIGFHPGCDVEIELIAAADGRSADAR